MAKESMDPDPLLDFISDGRIKTYPLRPRAEAVVLAIDLDQLHTCLLSLLTTHYLYCQPIRNRYGGHSSADTDNLITLDLTAMADLAIWVCYNRLRRVAERYALQIRITRMNHEAPCSDKMEFPLFVCQLLQTIGPLRVDDAGFTAIYAPAADKMETYGRAGVPSLHGSGHYRIVSMIKQLGFQVSTIDSGLTEAHGDGYFWTTCIVEKQEEEGYNVIGTLHCSHYVNEDIAKALCLLNNPDLPVFQRLAWHVGYGICPAAAASSVCRTGSSLAHRINSWEINGLIRYRLNRKTTEA